ncbi:MAG: class IV adenylate cyclase [bacterium]
MPSNVEIKARARDPLALRDAAARLCGSAPATLQQEDTFFATPRGRLKLRVIASCASPTSGAAIPASAPSAELIYYERANAHGPRESAYVISPVSDVATMRETLARAFGITGVVRKTRTLYLAEQTRIHLDEVEALGAFVELETVLRPSQSIEDGARVTEALMQTLGISRDDLIDRAYVDLLQDRSKIRVGTPSSRG